MRSPAVAVTPPHSAEATPGSSVFVCQRTFPAAASIAVVVAKDWPTTGDAITPSYRSPTTCAREMVRYTFGIYCARTYSRPVRGEYAIGCQFAPPCGPGVMRTPA